MHIYVLNDKAFSLLNVSFHLAFTIDEDYNMTGQVILQYIPRKDPCISHVQHVMICVLVGSLSKISNVDQSIELLINLVI